MNKSLVIRYHCFGEELTRVLPNPETRKDHIDREKGT